MESSESGGSRDQIAENMYLGSTKAFSSGLVDSSDLSAADIDQISRVMNALARLREAERELSEASRRFMKLSTQDMQALHYLIAARREGAIVTPGMLSRHLSISAASATKLINRLERDGHVVRRVHPSDRRAFAIEITPATAASARETVGRAQSRRIHSAARLNGHDREAVIRFLEDMTTELSTAHSDWTQ